jgi:AcrR family transcriptional regulator
MSGFAAQNLWRGDGTLQSQSDKTDRRVQHTRQALREGIVRLLGRKPIDKISVKELCEEADINRSTFYAHYSSPDDLLEQVERELFRDLDAYLDGYSFKADEEESFKKLVMIFEYVAENAELCAPLMSGNGDPGFQTEIMTLVQNQVRDWHDAQAGDAELIEYMLTFCVNGSLGIVRKWLQSGLNKSASAIAELVMLFTYRGTSDYLPSASCAPTANGNDGGAT